MKKIILIVLAYMVSQSFAQDMRLNSFSSLFSDQKASKIGDAITILVVESSQASSDAETSAGRTSNLGLTGQLNTGKATSPSLSATAGTTNNFSGTGSTANNGTVNTKISATVDSVLANGNLVIDGSRQIIINGQEQTVHIKGIVRPADIAADNSVLSYNISQAQIVFKGDGMINSVQSPGWLTKFLHWIF